jgi:trans-aconitate 2-methyltransferase
MTYLKYGDERARPFFELVARVAAESPRTVVDLGCGPGTLTVDLAARWPATRIEGIDSSPEMIDKAAALGSSVEFALGDVRDWAPGPAVDVVICNATLQWVSGHTELLTRWVRSLPPGAWLAVQVPGNFDAPSHRALRAVAALPRWRDHVASVVRGPESVLDPSGYASLLLQTGCAVDAWETTYLHLLPAGAAGHPVLRWMEGTALRPVRSALADEEWARFRDELASRLAEAYPAEGALIPFAFRRIFFVARTPGTENDSSSVGPPG